MTYSTLSARSLRELADMLTNADREEGWKPVGGPLHHEIERDRDAPAWKGQRAPNLVYEIMVSKEGK